MMYVALVLIIIAVGIALWFLLTTKITRKQEKQLRTTLELEKKRIEFQRSPQEIEKDLEASGLCKCGLPYIIYWPGNIKPRAYDGDPKDVKAFTEYQDRQLLMCRGSKNAPCRNSMTVKQHREAMKLMRELSLVLKKP